MKGRWFIYNRPYIVKSTSLCSWLYSGSALTWSHISYALRGSAVMEESYDTQAKQAEAERGPKEEKRRFFSVGEETRGLKHQNM